MKNPIAWHEGCYKNTESYIENEKVNLNRNIKMLNDLLLEHEHYKKQTDSINIFYRKSKKAKEGMKKK